MRVLLLISLRNLLRQKRRNVLLGTAIAFGAMILVLANAFAHGISDVLFTRVVKYTSGHVSVNFTKNGDMFRPVFHDGDRILRIARENVEGLTQIQETVGYIARAIGNGTSDNVILVGIDLDAYASEEEVREAEDNFRMIEGKFEDVADTTVENPVLLSQQKAEYLNVKKGDIVRLRVRDMNGQDKAVRLTVVGIFKPASIFMAAPAFVEMDNAKRILGYGPHDIAQLYITIEDPRHNAKAQADKLHGLLHPPLAVIAGRAEHDEARAAVSVVTVGPDSSDLPIIHRHLRLVEGDSAAAWGARGSVIGSGLAARIGAHAGDTLIIHYRDKFDSADTSFTLVVGGVFESDDPLTERLVLLNERDFYKTYYTHWPMPPAAVAGALAPDSSHPLAAALGREYILLPRSTSTAELQERYKDVVQRQYRAVTVDVRSMYETASAVLGLEYALNLITFVAVLVLFVVILIGVVNTLRMTVRERTREIGTVRAIGMQRRDVRRVFLLETLFLALFASLAGTVAGFAAMWGLSSITLDPGDNPLGMLLVNKHLHFAPTAVGTVGYVALILVIAVATAWGPARRAARMTAAEALRHYD
jgi:ABC-type lipoprotein release transport system permease subunit